MVCWLVFSMSWVAPCSLRVIFDPMIWFLICWCLGGMRPSGVIFPRYCPLIFCARCFCLLYLLVILRR